MATKTFNLDAGPNGQGDGALPAVAAQTSDTRNAVTRELHNFVADVEDLITTTTSLTGADLARVKARVFERAAAAKDAIAGAGTAVAQGARRTATATDQYVHGSPWKAVGIAAAAATAVGMLLGFLLARR